MLKAFGISHKKFNKNRVVMAALFTVIAVLLINMFAKPVYFISVPFIGFLGYKWPYIDLKNRKKRIDAIKQYAFPNFLRYFISLLDTQGNVYQTLKTTVAYVQEPIKGHLEKLIQDIDDNNVSDRKAFMDFASEMGSGDAILVMSIIHDFHAEGIIKENIKELEDNIIRLQENKVNELIEIKVQRMGRHANPILLYSIGFVLVFTGITFLAYMSQLAF